MNYTQIRPGAPVYATGELIDFEYCWLELKFYWDDVDDLFNDVNEYYVTEEFKVAWQKSGCEGAGFIPIDAATMVETNAPVLGTFYYFGIYGDKGVSDVYVGEDKELYGSDRFVALIKSLKWRDIDFGPDPLREVRKAQQKKIAEEMYFDEKTNSLRWKDESKNS